MDWQTGAAIATTVIAAMGWWTTNSQLRQTQADLDDKRLDGKVDAAFGNRLDLMLKLMNEAREVLDQAKAGLADVQTVRSEVESIRAELKEQAELVSDGRGQLTTMITKAEVLVQRINDESEQVIDGAKVVADVVNDFEIVRDHFSGANLVPKPTVLDKILYKPLYDTPLVNIGPSSLDGDSISILSPRQTEITNLLLNMAGNDYLSRRHLPETPQKEPTTNDDPS